MEKILLNEAMTGESAFIPYLPGKWKIPHHEFVSLRVDQGRVKHMPGFSLGHDLKGVRLIVSGKYKGQPITLVGTQME